MKKSLIALAVLAASGAAMAQSSVTLYGIVDAGIAHEDNGSAKTTRLDSGGLNGSRWGLNGTEDLGGGLKAIFTLEAGLNLDTGAQFDTAKMFNRQSFVGVQSGFGTVKLGRQNNPLEATAGTWDSFANGLAGASSRLFSFNGNRTDNMVTYNYAAGGFYGELQYGLGEVVGNNAITGEDSLGRTAAMFVGYKAGPFDVVLTHQNIHNTPSLTDSTYTTKMTLLGGNYDLGMVKLFAAYAQEDAYKAGLHVNQKDAHLGLTAPIGSAGTVKLSYLRKDDDRANYDAEQFAIGYVHNLSKRTALYTSYAQLKNDANANYKTATTAGNTDGFGKTDKLFNIGVRHTF